VAKEASMAVKREHHHVYDKSNSMIKHFLLLFGLGESDIPQDL